MLNRRELLKQGALGSAAFVGATAFPTSSALSDWQSHIELSPVTTFNAQQQSHWLGGHFWGNRLQDWQLNQGWLECLRFEKDFEVRTASLLTRQLNAELKPARLQVFTQNLRPQDQGFAGFLLGIGAGKLDYRGAALAQRAAGECGGIMAVINAQGQLSIRDFSSTTTPSLTFETLKQSPQALPAQSTILLDCQLEPDAQGLFNLYLSAIAVTDREANQPFAQCVLKGIAPQQLQGGISLVSSPEVKSSSSTNPQLTGAITGARWRFKNIATGGEKISVRPSQQLGEVIGCLYSINSGNYLADKQRGVMKLSAQLMPVDLKFYQSATLAIKPRFNSDAKQSTSPTSSTSATWQTISTVPIEHGYVARFRVEHWDSSLAFDYRITSNVDPDKVLYQGRIAADPAHATQDEFKIALFSCILPTAKSLDELDYRPFIQQEQPLARYSADNILFPHQQLVSHCDQHQPDLYVFCGDQYYETFPTRYGRDTPDRELDTLYRWYLWYWTFAESTRNKPAIMLADDHDVLQGNLWGAGGKFSQLPKEEDGGFKWDKDLVRMIYRIQHGHNPDPFEPTPILDDIPVAYAQFVYGGVNFALVEDRKFKSPPDYQADKLRTTGELLGKRQEDFLKQWQQTQPQLPKICLTASIWGSPQTDPQGKPLVDYDANGYPADGRKRAVQLVSEAKALVLAGDQHLAMVAQQGLNDFDDGATFFSGPAAAAFWQRWFEGHNQLPNQYQGKPNTGNFTDSFGNKMRVLAVANPKISHQTFEKTNRTWGKFIADHRLKSEGYGLVRVNHQQQQYVLECWPWHANPQTDPQFEDFPVLLTFEGKPR